MPCPSRSHDQTGNGLPSTCSVSSHNRAAVARVPGGGGDAEQLRPAAELAEPGGADEGPAVERGFGRLKNDWGLSPSRVRGLPLVRLHADLTILAKLACALACERVAYLAA